MYEQEKMEFIKEVIGKFFDCKKEEVSVEVCKQDDADYTDVYSVRAICPYLPEENSTFYFPSDVEVSIFFYYYPGATIRDVFCNCCRILH